MQSRDEEGQQPHEVAGDVITWQWHAIVDRLLISLIALIVVIWSDLLQEHLMS